MDSGRDAQQALLFTLAHQSERLLSPTIINLLSYQLIDSSNSTMAVKADDKAPAGNSRFFIEPLDETVDEVEFGGKKYRKVALGMRRLFNLGPFPLH